MIEPSKQHLDTTPSLYHTVGKIQSIRSSWLHSLKTKNYITIKNCWRWHPMCVVWHERRGSVLDRFHLGVFPVFILCSHKCSLQRQKTLLYLRLGASRRISLGSSRALSLTAGPSSTGRGPFHSLSPALWAAPSHPAPHLLLQPSPGKSELSWPEVAQDSPTLMFGCIFMT